MVAEGVVFKEIVEKRGLKAETIIDHIEQLLEEAAHRPRVRPGDERHELAEAVAEGLGEEGRRPQALERFTGGYADAFGPKLEHR